MSIGHAACATRHRHSRCATADRCRAVRAHSSAAQAVLAWARARSAAQPRMRDAATRAAEPLWGHPCEFVPFDGSPHLRVGRIDRSGEYCEWDGLRLPLGAIIAPPQPGRANTAPHRRMRLNKPADRPRLRSPQGQQPALDMHDQAHAHPRRFRSPWGAC